jgi:hypothetical protein
MNKPHLTHDAACLVKGYLALGHTAKSVAQAM